MEDEKVYNFVNTPKNINNNALVEDFRATKFSEGLAQAFSSAVIDSLINPKKPDLS